jgi:hypothetical protein
MSSKNFIINISAFAMEPMLYSVAISIMELDFSNKAHLPTLIDVFLVEKFLYAP